MREGGRWRERERDRERERKRGREEERKRRRGRQEEREEQRRRERERDRTCGVVVRSVLSTDWPTPQSPRAPTMPHVVSKRVAPASSCQGGMNTHHVVRTSLRGTMRQRLVHKRVQGGCLVVQSILVCCKLLYPPPLRPTSLFLVNCPRSHQHLTSRRSPTSRASFQKLRLSHARKWQHIAPPCKFQSKRATFALRI